MIAESTADTREPAGHSLTFDEARDRYQEMVFAYVSRRLPYFEEAQDITAQVFVEAFRRWRRVKGSERLYLLGIARNKVKDSIRKRRPFVTIREEDLHSNGLDSFVSLSEVMEAHNIVMKLPTDERDAILLQVLEELPVRDIAIVLGRSPKAVNSLLQRARGRIQKMVEASSNRGGW